MVLVLEEAAYFGGEPPSFTILAISVVMKSIAIAVWILFLLYFLRMAVKWKDIVKQVVAECQLGFLMKEVDRIRDFIRH